MLEVGKTYKLKKIKDFFGTNTEEDFKILEMNDDIVHCVSTETNEHYVFRKDMFIDPDFPNDIYSDIQIVWEKLDKVITTRSTSWKELKECGMATASTGAAATGTSAVSQGTTSSSLGASPTPAVGQVQATTVNGIPVLGKSVMKKKKRKKKNEAVTWLPDGPEADFHVDNDKSLEFESAINLIRYGQTEEELDEYKEYLDLFNRHDCMKQFLEYAYNKYNLSAWDLTVDKFGIRESSIMEKPLFLKFKQASKAYEEGRISFEEYDNILNEYRDVFNKLVFGVDKSYYESVNNKKYRNKRINEKRKKFIVRPKKKIILDDMEDETGLNIEENIDIHKLNKRLNQVFEAINSDGIIGADDTIVQWLDEMEFESSSSKEGFLYYYDKGNYEHIFFYNKDINNPSIRYEIKDNNETIYHNIWIITPSISIKDILNQITNVFNRFE